MKSVSLLSWSSVGGTAVFFPLSFFGETWKFGVKPFHHQLWAHHSGFLRPAYSCHLLTRLSLSLDLEKGENSFVLLQLLEANLPQVYGKVGNPDGAVRLGNQGQGGLSVFPPDHVYYCSNLRSEGDSNSSNLLCHNLPQDSIRLLDQHTLQCYLLSILLNKKGLLFETICSASLLSFTTITISTFSDRPNSWQLSVLLCCCGDPLP